MGVINSHSIEKRLCTNGATNSYSIECCPYAFYAQPNGRAQTCEISGGTNKARAYIYMCMYVMHVNVKNKSNGISNCTSTKQTQQTSPCLLICLNYGHCNKRNFETDRMRSSVLLHVLFHVSFCIPKHAHPVLQSDARSSGDSCQK